MNTAITDSSSSERPAASASHQILPAPRLAVAAAVDSLESPSAYRGLLAQAAVQLRVGSRELSASDWRGHFMSANLLSEAQLHGVVIHVGEEVTTLFGVTPSGHAALMESAPHLFGSAATRLGRPLWGSEAKVLSLGVTGGAPHRCEVSRIVGAKRGDWWTPMSKDELTVEAVAHLQGVIERGIVSQAAQWGIALPEAPKVRILDAGRPMPIRAVRESASGGKPPFVMARVGLTVEINLALQGEWFVGPLRGLGFGRLLACRWYSTGPAAR
ncbi:MAG: hypothetical protein ABI831_22820 [Betaproteobacteria bacterium]